MKVWLLQLEPLTERYTEQWSRWIPQALERHGIDYEVVTGDVLCDHIETGAFLDVHSSNFHRFDQLKTIAKLFKEGKIKTGDVIWSFDFYHPGLEAVRYIADLTGVDIKIVANYHACSVTDEDFVVPLAKWSQFFEVGWVAICDLIFFQTKYAMQKFVDIRSELILKGHWLGDKIYAVGNPWDSRNVIWMMAFENKYPQVKKRQVIFPNRWDQEKRPLDFLDIARRVKGVDPTIEFVVTTSRPYFRSTTPELEREGLKAEVEGIITIKSGLSKSEYYEEMAKSKLMISTSIEENWGYCVTEAATLGTVPICTNGYSYKELLPEKWLFNTNEEAAEIILDMIDKDESEEELKEIVEYADTTIDRIIKLIKEVTQ